MQEQKRPRPLHRPLLVTVPIAVLAACASTSNLPRLEEARPAPLISCPDLATRIRLPDTAITAAESIAAGALKVAGRDIAAHCRITGRMLERTSSVDNQRYAIGFEMRLPLNWNGRFYYQANGGLDGNVVTAVGATGGGPLDNALAKGFAVLSSDAGHPGSMGPFFGIDPQARLDYGYQAVGKLTPMAKKLIESAYGVPPDRSYIGGCSNGGRHAMVAAARYADLYDGVLAGNPGTRLPLAGIANMAGAQAYAALASTPGEPGTGFSKAERNLVARAVLERCDALDGATDGLVQDTAACQARFDLARDVPTCSGARDGSCLSGEQKRSIDALFKGATTRAGARIYASFPYDNGVDTDNWATWKFTNSLNLDPGAVGFVWGVPPDAREGFNGPRYALGADLDALLARVHATNATYTENAMSLSAPPGAGALPALRQRGAKLMVYHGTADPIFSADDTVAWYQGAQRQNGRDTAAFARLYLVPGMNHCAGGPATEQFDMLQSLVDWVEKGIAPDRVIASARGAGNTGGVNADVPAYWSPTRTRPLCPWPQVARYDGKGDLEQAASFVCR